MSSRPLRTKEASHDTKGLVSYQGCVCACGRTGTGVPLQCVVWVLLATTAVGLKSACSLDVTLSRVLAKSVVELKTAASLSVCPFPLFLRVCGAILV